MAPRKSAQSLSQTLSQSQSQISQADVNVEENADDLVRYFIHRAGEHILFKKAEIQKNVLPKVGKRFDEVLRKAAKILKEVYGYEVRVIDAKQKSTKSYIITNILPHVKDPTVAPTAANEPPEDVDRILTLLILTHIFMSNNSVSDNSLYNFLKSFGFDTERKHEIFGNIQDFIQGTLKNKKYINIETDPLSKRTYFSWGDRAENEISKHEVLQFVCKIYKSAILPSSWTVQFKAANEQHLNSAHDETPAGQTQNTQE